MPRTIAFVAVTDDDSLPIAAAFEQFCAANGLQSPWLWTSIPTESTVTRLRALTGDAAADEMGLPRYETQPSPADQGIHANETDGTTAGAKTGTITTDDVPTAARKPPSTGRTRRGAKKR